MYDSSSFVEVLGGESVWRAQMVQAGKEYTPPSVTTVPAETISVPRRGFWANLKTLYRDARANVRAS
jgi:hypothetical protein